MAENYGIKVGTNIVTDTTAQLKETSKHSSLKIYKWNKTASTALSGDTATVEVAHDLNYAPSILAFAEKTTGVFQPLGGNDDTSGVFAFSDEDKLYVQAFNAYGKITVLPPVKYYLLVDKSEDFSGTTNIALTGDYGFKVSNPGEDVLTAPEYKMNESSKYKALQYFSESIKTETLTLPAMNASLSDQDVEEEQYVDFTHGLGYPPAFMVWFYSGSTYQEAPYAEYSTYLEDDLTTETPYTSASVSAFCDSTKIRVTFHRRSIFDIYNLFANATMSYPDHAASTITIKVLPFAENLSGLNYGE
jgi:hypothetical protein